MSTPSITFEPKPSLPDPAGPLTPSGNLRRRAAVSRAIEFAATVSAVFAVLLLADLAWTVVKNGAAALSFSFVFTNPSGLGGGGMANALIGSALVVGFAALIAIPIGVLTGIYLTEFAGPDARSARALKLVLDLLQGLPTVIVGVVIFGLIVVRHPARDRLCGFARAGDRDAAADRPLEPGGAAPRAGDTARSGRRARRRSLAHGARRHPPDCDGRYRHRRDPVDRARSRRDRPGAVRRQHLQPHHHATRPVRPRRPDRSGLHLHHLRSSDPDGGRPRLGARRWCCSRSS